MIKTKALWLIIATLVLIISLLIFVVAMSSIGWDFRKINQSSDITNSYDIEENVDTVSVFDDTADIYFVTSSDDKLHVVCHEEKNLKHSVTVKDGKLEIKLIDERKWYEHISPFNFSKHKVIVHLPKETVSALMIDSSTGDVNLSRELSFSSLVISLSTGDVKVFASVLGNTKIETSTGDVSLSGASFDSIDLKVSTGDIELSSLSAGDIKMTVSSGSAELNAVNCKTVTTSGSTGDVDFERVVVSGKLSITRSTGDVEFEDCDAAELYVKTSTGDVEGSLLTSKIFFTKSSTGRINVPKTTSGGACEIETSTGDIEIYIKSVNN